MIKIDQDTIYTNEDLRDMGFDECLMGVIEPVAIPGESFEWYLGSAILEVLEMEPHDLGPIETNDAGNKD
jgi:hypothetical protein